MELIPSKGKSRRGGKKNRKYGRAGRRPAKHRYNLQMRWIANKIKRIKRHLKRCPKDLVAQKALGYLIANG